MAAQTGAALRYEPVEEDSSFARDVIAGLAARPKRLPPKYFYDEAGAQLFEQITALPEYYPTRCELELLRERAPDIGAFLPAGLGADRVRQRLEQEGADPARGGADDRGLCAGRHLLRDARPGGGRACAAIIRSFAVLPVEADFTKPFALPAAAAGMAHVGFFPGSTIGNFEPHEACSFLRHAGRMLGRGATLIIGVDLVKDAEDPQCRLQ